MPLMTWTEKLSVGVSVLDEDHRKLVDLLNRLHDGMKAGQGKETVGKVLDGLVSYTKLHFAREEDLFAKTGYPAAAHKREHDLLLDQALGLQARYKAGELALSVETADFLKSWLTTHIQVSDRGYGPHLNANGIY